MLKERGQYSDGEGSRTGFVQSEEGYRSSDRCDRGMQDPRSKKLLVGEQERIQERGVETNHCLDEIASAKHDEVGVVLERVERSKQSVNSLHT